MRCVGSYCSRNGVAVLCSDCLKQWLISAAGSDEITDAADLVTVKWPIRRTQCGLGKSPLGRKNSSEIIVEYSRGRTIDSVRQNLLRFYRDLTQREKSVLYFLAIISEGVWERGSRSIGHWNLTRWNSTAVFGYVLNKHHSPSHLFHTVTSFVSCLLFFRLLASTATAYLTHLFTDQNRTLTYRRTCIANSAEAVLVSHEPF